MTWKRLDYGCADDGKIILPPGPPFDGKPVLVATNTGVVEAWWEPWHATPTFDDPHDGNGYCWLCYDDAFQLELDDVRWWMPLIPVPVEGEVT